jgi:NAD(P)-dependent dehydrogenase (short-subunit alcohol dehydrogenase family)
VIPGDLSDFSLSQRAVDIAVSAFGKVDGLIVNHGILGEVARIADCDPAGIRKTFDVNFFSAIACVSWTVQTGNEAAAAYGCFSDLELNLIIMQTPCAACDPFADTIQIKAAIPELRKTHGRIILTSSGGAITGYSTWGAYGSSKAAMNHLALTLKAEEPDITTIAIRPGVVDTEMQRELREVHHDRMDKKDKERFMSAKANGTCKWI